MTNIKLLNPMATVALNPEFVVGHRFINGAETTLTLGELVGLLQRCADKFPDTITMDPGVTIYYAAGPFGTHGLVASRAVLDEQGRPIEPRY